MDGQILTLSISLHSVLTFGSVWPYVRLCENIPTHIKSHLNSKYALDFSETEIILSVLAENAVHYENKRCSG